MEEIMEPVRINVGTTISPLCADCGDEIAAFEIDGTDQRLGYQCVGNYIPSGRSLTLGEIERRLIGARPAENELRAMWGDR